MECTVDPFGFKGQAQDYDLERPRYPQKFIEEIINQTPSFTNYIDIASGTGLLFYEVAEKFNGKLVVNDRSSKQLQVAKEKLKDHNLNPEKIEFVESDSLEIHNKLSTPTKFDLVTVAQALHWFDPDKFCQYTIDHLLGQSGTFAVLGYFCDGIDYNFPEDNEFMKLGQKHYDRFYSIVLPHFDCDRISLDQGHKNFEFGKYFEKTEFFEEKTRVEISHERFSKYIGTYSAYNILKSKMGNNVDYEDPLQTFRKNTQQDLDNYYFKHSLPVKEKPFILKMHFFMWILRKGVKTL